MSRIARSPLQPFSAVVRFVVALLVVFTCFGVAGAAFDDSGSFLGWGDGASVCAEPRPRFTGSSYDEGMQAYRALLEPGARVAVHRLEICDDSPDLAQRVLYSLTAVPTLLLYFAVFYLFLSLLRTAEADGPFSPLVAGRLRTVGWTLVVGGYLAHALQDGASAALADTIAVPGGLLHNGLGPVLAEGALTLPLPDLLAGLGLLTIARIMQIGTRMHDELATTI